MKENEMIELDFAKCVELCDEILEMSDEYNGDIRVWREQCLRRTATYQMFKCIKERYLKETGKEDVFLMPVATRII